MEITETKFAASVQIKKFRISNNTIFSIFIPPVRKTLFLQKKIKLLNVQFMVKIVIAQMRDNLALEPCLFSVLILKTMYTLNGMDNTRRQAATNKQVEILFKFSVVPFSDDVAFLQRTSLEILNSLKLRYSNGRNIAMTKVIIWNVLFMIVPFVEMLYKVLLIRSSIARRVSILRLVILMCDERLDNTLPDIVQCSSREVREKKIQEIQ